MNIQIFGTSKCFDTKKAQRWFQERRIKFQMVDLKKFGMSRGELASVKNAVGLEAMINPGHPDAVLLSYLAEHADNRVQRREGVDCAEAAADYIINHYAEPMTVEALADHLSVSHSSLYRKFVQRYQISPKRFLLEYRIDRASTLLATTNRSVQEISNSVGFDDPFYFSRAFKEMKGVSPRHYAMTHQRREREEGSGEEDAR